MEDRLSGDIDKLEERRRSTANKAGVPFVRLVVHFLESPHDITNSTATRDTAVNAARTAVGGIYSLFMMVWILDARTDYQLVNIAYGLAISGGAGLLMTGIDVGEISRKNEENHSDISEENARIAVKRTLGYLFFGFGFFLQIIIVYLNAYPNPIIQKIALEPLHFNVALALFLIPGIMSTFTLRHMIKSLKLLIVFSLFVLGSAYVFGTTGGIIASLLLLSVIPTYFVGGIFLDIAPRIWNLITNVLWEELEIED